MKIRAWLEKLALFVYKKWRLAGVLAVIVLMAGFGAYYSFLPREGFPPVQFPITIVNGVYFVDSPEQVDKDITQPVSAALADVEGVSEVQSSAVGNAFSLFVSFEQSVVPEKGTEAVRSSLESINLPESAQLSLTTLDASAFLGEFDLLLSVYSASEVSYSDLQAQATRVSAVFAADERIDQAAVIPVIEEVVDPTANETIARQTAFNQVGVPAGEALAFNNAITIGINGSDSLDVLDLSKAVREIEAKIAADADFSEVKTTIGADYAPSVNTQINSLQGNLFTGVLAVALISWLLITWRASIITGVFMVSVMLVSMLVLLAVGYSLNTITLFALVLALGLFVDDATIVVEAIVAGGKKGDKLQKAIGDAVKKVGAASIAGTLTTVLVFLPLVFVSGILGEFIRLMPVTVIIALLVSLVLSITLIPLMARLLLSRAPAKPSAKALFEQKLARGLAGIPRLLKTKPMTGRLVGVAMVVMSIGFFMASGSVASRVEFNIFPPSDDSDQIGVNLSFAPGTTLKEAEAVALEANEVISSVVGSDATKAIYAGFSGSANERGADLILNLTPFTERDRKSPEIITQLEQQLEVELEGAATARVIQLDAGPPSEDFPFKVQVLSEDKAEAFQLAREIETFLIGREIERENGSSTVVNSTRITGQGAVNRVDGKRYLQVEAGFAAEDVSALVSAAQADVEERFPPEVLSENIELGFDFGQESESAESFAALGVVFPVAILAILLLLGLQFRSFIQPVLIILAIPFSLLGVFTALLLSDNPLSFFSSIGMIGLIGIAVNNTILLTDYANQERNKGKDAVDAISAALEQRFRPLVATTLTTIVALLPLALNDPFWQPLAVTIMGGLLSSTFLVVFSFAYYYLAAEWLRSKSKLVWLRVRKRA